MAILLSTPMVATLMVTMSSQAAAECRTQQTGGYFAAPAPNVQAALIRLRFNDSYPTLTAEQASNAVIIAQVARDLEIPRQGLEIAIATAVQESKLVNLDGGDRDSGGLFQQRPSQGWGTRAQITSPELAARAFFGRANHTNNRGLLDVPGWETMPLTVAAQSVQHSGFASAYAQWEPVAEDITDLLGGDLPALPPSSTSDGCGAGKIVYPVPAQYVGNDAHNWHDTGGNWGSWHTGTDFGAPCGTPVYAAHTGTIEVDTTQGWAGPWLVKVSTGPTSLSTWYAHMQRVTVSRGQIVQAGQRIGVVGDVGNRDGCHLHFEVHERNGSIYGSDNVDPSQWLAENVRRVGAAA